MATNGNDPRLEQLENTLRGATGTLPAAPNLQPAASAVGNGGAGAETYDLMKRAADTARAMRDLAEYSNNVAGDIDRIVAGYVSNMNRLLGRAE